jgi:hypothetical protein
MKRYRGISTNEDCSDVQRMQSFQHINLLLFSVLIIADEIIILNFNTHNY